MPKEISWETRERAERLYIEQGLTIEQTAKATGVSVSQLKRWATDEGWKERRKEHLELKRTFDETLFKLQQTWMEKAINSEDPQVVYAAIRLMRLAQDRERKEDAKEPDIDRPKIFLEDLEFIAETLQEIDPEGLKVLARNFETIVQRFKDAQTA